MTGPHNPGEPDPADSAPRRGRHAAPDDDYDLPADDESAALDPAPAGEPESSDGGFAGDVGDDDPMLARAQHADATQPDEAADAAIAAGTTGFGSGAVVAAAARAAAADDTTGAPSRPRHAAEGSSFRLQPWMIWLAAALVVGLVVLLIFALSGGDDDEPANGSPASATTVATSTAPTPVDPAALPQVLCMGSSYAMIETGLPTEQLLADPAAIEAQYPGSQLATIPPGCIADTDTRDQVVLALGPFPTIEEACAAGQELQGVAFKAYAGSASTGLTETTCD